jgi:formate--tetrahydrofolate ligase
MKKYGVPVVVAINRFGTDNDNELEIIKDYCKQIGAGFALSDVFAKGGEGGVELAKAVIDACEQPSNFKPIYDLDLSIEQKIEAVAKKIYGASEVIFTDAAKKNIADIRGLSENMPVCIAKTQYSLSDNPELLGRPEGFAITIRAVTLSNGAGFAVALAGSIMTMPGLPKAPAAERIDVTESGDIVGLF